MCPKERRVGIITRGVSRDGGGLWPTTTFGALFNIYIYRGKAGGQGVLNNGTLQSMPLNCRSVFLAAADTFSTTPEKLPLVLRLDQHPKMYQKGTILVPCIIYTKGRWTRQTGEIFATAGETEVFLPEATRHGSIKNIDSSCALCLYTTDEVRRKQSYRAEKEPEDRRHQGPRSSPFISPLLLTITPPLSSK